MRNDSLIPPLNILMSYYYMRRDLRLQEWLKSLAPYANVMIDSGAFTNLNNKHKALKEGKQPNEVTLKEVIEAYKRLHGNVWGYIQLDVIYDPPGTLNNLKTMFNAGLTPIPVFTSTEKVVNIDQYVAYNPIVALGGIAGGAPGNTPAYAINRMRLLWEKTQQKIRLHSLGWIKLPEIWDLPVLFCDSSSYCAGGRFGSFAVYSPRTGFSTASYKDIINKPNGRGARLMLGELRKAGVSIADIKDSTNYRRVYGIPSLFTVFNYVKFHVDATRRGLSYFFASPNVSWVTPILGVIATMDDRASTFNYREAKKIKIHLDELWRQGDDTKFFAQTHAILKRHTNQNLAIL